MKGQKISATGTAQKLFVNQHFPLAYPLPAGEGKGEGESSSSSFDFSIGGSPSEATRGSTGVHSWQKSSSLIHLSFSYQPFQLYPNHSNSTQPFSQKKRLFIFSALELEFKLQLVLFAFARCLCGLCFAPPLARRRCVPRKPMRTFAYLRKITSTIPVKKISRS
jgi:hypothetical protein